MAGYSFAKTMMIIAIAGALFSVGSSTLPKLYEYYILRDLANRVTQEYNTLPLEEVQRRVQFEFNRSRITIPEASFQVLDTGHGYRVTFHYTVPLVLHIGEKQFSLDGYEQWKLIYKVES